MKTATILFLCLAFASVSGQDVPAVQERYLAHHNGDSCHISGDSDIDSALGCRYTADEYALRWTCSDPSAALMTSVSGKEHWCHKPQTATKDVRIDTTYHGPADSACEEIGRRYAEVGERYQCHAVALVPIDGRLVLGRIETLITWEVPVELAKLPDSLSKGEK